MLFSDLVHLVEVAALLFVPAAAAVSSCVRVLLVVFCVLLLLIAPSPKHVFHQAIPKSKHVFPNTDSTITNMFGIK